MKIQTLEINNFRSIKKQKIDLHGLTTFVGANGSGKSNFLKALDCFYRAKSSVTQDDFFNRDDSNCIEIVITYHELATEELDVFNKYLSPNKTLSVIKRFNAANTEGKYYGKALGNSKFKECKKSKIKVAELVKEYNNLRENEEYKSLPKVKNKDTILSALKDWEEENLDKLEPIEEEYQFFGFGNSSISSLEKFTKFVYIPAVLNEDLLSDCKNSPISDLTDILARKQLKEDKEIQKLQEEISEKYANKLKPFNAGKMEELSAGLSNTLKGYYRDVNVSIKLDETQTQVNLPTPKANIKIYENGFDSLITSSGQGLQRAFILSLLQYFAENQIDSESEGFHLIIGIDEPELYQHPSKQKLFYKVLRRLTKEGSSLAKSVQCCFTTHSSLMLNIEHFDEIVRVYKEQYTDNSPHQTETKSSSLRELAIDLEYKELKLLSSMVNVINSRVNEGFFSKTVVLVEGESDVVALKMAAKYHSQGGVDFDILDIPIISCEGKGNLHKPKSIFDSLGIATYTIWDSDYSYQNELDKCQVQEQNVEAVEDKNKKTAKTKQAKKSLENNTTLNKRLLSIHKETEEDWPHFISTQCASFKYDLEYTLERDIGSTFNGLISSCNEEIQAKKPKKNPLVMTAVLEDVFSRGIKSSSLEGIITKILELNNAQVKSESIENAA